MKENNSLFLIPVPYSRPKGVIMKGRCNKKIRTMLKMSLSELSDKSGYSLSELSRWFSGKRSPSLEVVARIADITKTDAVVLMNYFLGLKNER